MIVSEAVSIKDGSNLLEILSLIGIGVLGFHGFSFRLLSGLFETMGITKDILLKARQSCVSRALVSWHGSRRRFRLGSRRRCRLVLNDGNRLGRRCRLGSRRSSLSVEAAIANVLRSKVKVCISLLKLFLKLIDRLHCSFLLSFVLRFRLGLRLRCGCRCFFSFNSLTIGTIRARATIGRTGSTIGRARTAIGRAGTTIGARSRFCWARATIGTWGRFYWARATIGARSRSAVGRAKSL